MDIFIITLIFLAGILAGVFTGFSGGSATNIFIPVLVIFAGYTPYTAVGVALVVDVFSCLMAYYIYNKNVSVNYGPFLPLLLASLVGVFIGSFISFGFSSKTLSILIGIGICFIAYKFFRKKKDKKTKTLKNKKLFRFFIKYRLILLIFAGLILGIICGLFGGGGGLMLLAVLILILNYKTHQAIAASIWIMIFLALFGGVIHYVYSPFAIVPVLVGCIGGIIGARYSAMLANIISEEKLNKIIALFLFILGIGLLISGLF